MTLRNEPLENIVNRFVKRLFDIGFSTLVFILFLWWFIPLIALIIKLTSKGPVFFIQERSGIKNKSFNVIKFRTMYVNDDAHYKQATKYDERITPIGKFLRSTSLDEMPQFINVLTGQMSVIGPRPHMLKHTEEYSKIIDKFMVRHLVKPGITGWAQVNGYRGETKEVEDMEGRVRADVWYIENWSFTLDIKIIILTIINLLRGEENAF
jgi:exopolysaccharide biosynthesis polyprenyl glycosylphosphotransferase